MFLEEVTPQHLIRSIYFDLLSVSPAVWSRVGGAGSEVGKRSDAVSMGRDIEATHKTDLPLRSLLH